MLPHFSFNSLENGLNMCNSDSVDNIRHLSCKELHLFVPFYPYSLFFLFSFVEWLNYIAKIIPANFTQKPILQKRRPWHWILDIFSSSDCHKVFFQKLTISRLYDKPRASSKGRICLDKKNIRIIFIGLQRLIPCRISAGSHWGKKLKKKKCHRIGFVRATYLWKISEIGGTDKLSSKTRKQTKSCLLVKQ